jgi:hexosaminidase
VTPNGGHFTLDPTTGLRTGPGLEGVAGWLRATLGPATGCWLAPGPDGITLDTDAGLGPEAYRLDVRPDAITVIGGDPAGVFYGLQTMLQLLPPEVYRAGRIRAAAWSAPAVSIADAPRFAWRGCLLDVARHFLPKADVLRFIDLLAMHKLNVLHLHLTDDQGWRLEVPRWPRLTEVGSWRRESMVGARRHARHDGRPHGGYYTRGDIAEIVAYAADRYVTVVPEVDMPGHMRAAIAAYPELGGGPGIEVWTSWGISRNVLAMTDHALAFCRDVLDEVCELFGSDRICLGGDECPTDEWQASPAARQRAADLGLPGPEALQAWFTAEMAAHLADRGRRIVAWDEVLDGGAPPDTLIAAWRGPEATARAVAAGHQVIACPTTSMYLDYRQSGDPAEPIPVGRLLTLADVLAFDPVPAGLSEAAAALVIGVQANVWTEHMDSARVVDYMVFPRLCAAAEVAWCGPGRDEDDFAARLLLHKGRLRARGVEYRRDDGPRPWQTRPDARGWPVD